MPKPTRYKEGDLPPPGSVFIAPLADGRFGAVRVLERSTKRGDAYARIVSSSWIGDTPVRPSDSVLRQSLVLNHHSHQNAHNANWVNSPPPPFLIPAGILEISHVDLIPQEESYSTWEGCITQILLQWRWDHDRESLLRDEVLAAQAASEEFRREGERRAEILRATNLQTVAARTWFDTWNEDIDGPFIDLSRGVLSRMIHALMAAPKVTKSLARKILKSAVQEFNALDEKAHFIATSHREDIYEALELIMFAVKQPDLAGKIDEWRDW
jgi:hypothetical protein